MKIQKILGHSLFKSSLIYTFSDAINKSVPFFILPILSHFLLPSDYGIIANFNVILSIVSIFVMIGVDGAIGVNFYKLDSEALSKYIFNGLIIIFSAAFVTIVFFILFQSKVYEWVKIPFKFQLLTVLMALSMALTSINLSLWRLEEKPFKFGIYELSQTVVNISSSLLLVVVYKLGWIGRVDGMIFASVTFGCFSLWLLVKRGYLKFNFDENQIKQILLFGAPLIPHSLSFWIRSGIDRIFITKFINETATGLYATGFQFGLLISFLTLSFNNAFVPYLYKSLSEKNEIVLERNKKKLIKITYSIMISLVIMAFVFIVFSKLIITHLFDSKYLDAEKFISWAIISQVFQGFYLLFVNYIFFVKRTKLLATVTFCCALIQLFLSYFLIRQYGAIGGAYSTVIVSFINFMAVFILSRKVYPMKWF